MDTQEVSVACARASVRWLKKAPEHHHADRHRKAWTSAKILSTADDACVVGVSRAGFSLRVGSAEAALIPLARITRWGHDASDFFAEAAAADAGQAVAAAEASQCRQAAERMRVVCEEHCPGWAEGWALRVAALAAASEWVTAAEAAEQGLSKLGEHPKLLVLLGRCLLRTGHGATAAEKWERAVRLDPDDRAAVGLLKAYRRGVGSNGSVGAMQEVAAEERRQAGNTQQACAAQPESATEQDKENLEEEKQTLGEKQDDRVRALRSAQCEEASRASERERAAPAIIARLRARVDRKPFRQVLAEFGVPVAAGAGGEEGVAAAYRKALVKFHPDRALQRGLSAVRALIRSSLLTQPTVRNLRNLLACAKFACRSLV